MQLLVVVEQLEWATLLRSQRFNVLSVDAEIRVP